jgi:hypothetical protein
MAYPPVVLWFDGIRKSLFSGLHDIQSGLEISLNGEGIFVEFRKMKRHDQEERCVELFEPGPA